MQYMETIYLNFKYWCTQHVLCHLCSLTWLNVRQAFADFRSGDEFLRLNWPTAQPYNAMVSSDGFHDCLWKIYAFLIFVICANSCRFGIEVECLECKKYFYTPEPVWEFLNQLLEVLLRCMWQYHYGYVKSIPHGFRRQYEKLANAM